jgi:hypothetical protein
MRFALKLFGGLKFWLLLTIFPEQSAWDGLKQQFQTEQPEMPPGTAEYHRFVESIPLQILLPHPCANLPYVLSLHILSDVKILHSLHFVRKKLTRGIKYELI